MPSTRQWLAEHKYRVESASIPTNEKKLVATVVEFFMNANCHSLGQYIGYIVTYWLIYIDMYIKPRKYSCRDLEKSASMKRCQIPGISE
jgi:hypothetical protein